MTTPAAKRRSTFLGYRRPDGRVGSRNHIAVIAAMDNVNPVARRIAAAVPGAIAVTAAYGRGMVAADRDRHDQVMIEYGRHPNVAATLVVGLESVTASRWADAIGEAGKPVHWIAVQTEGSTPATVARGVEIVRSLAADAAKTTRTPCPLSDALIGLECGASDSTSGLTANATLGVVSDRLVAADGTVILSETEEIIGAEHLLAQRAATPDIGRQLLEAVAEAEALARFQGVQIWPLGEDNIRGGLSTMEEKSMGAVRKGGTSALREVIGYGERPSARGLVFMDAPAPGVENIAALAASGAQAILFTTGVGNPIGHPLVPTVKLTGNPVTAETFRENLDLDVAGIVSAGESLESAAERVLAHLLRVLEGETTAAERLGDTEISISRVDVGYLNQRRLRGAGEP